MHKPHQSLSQSGVAAVLIKLRGKTKEVDSIRTSPERMSGKRTYWALVNGATSARLQGGEGLDCIGLLPSTFGVIALTMEVKNSADQ